MKSFADLIQEVQDPGLCHQCGGCVAFCSAINYGALELGADGRPRYRDREKCIECGICHSICPVVHELDEDTKELVSWSAPLGRVMGKAVARAGARLLLAATGFVYGPENIGVVAASGCNFCTAYPYNPFAVPLTNSLVDFACTLDGHLGGCVNPHCVIWDIARACPLVPEAGGRFTDLHGEALRLELHPDHYHRSYAVVGGPPRRP
jgi:ferredoxin